MEHIKPILEREVLTIQRKTNLHPVMEAALNCCGISTTTLRSAFRYNTYYSHLAKKMLVQWDYRDIGGKLHSGVALSVSSAEKMAQAYGHIPQEAVCS
jgi:hypothetical protein